MRLTLTFLSTSAQKKAAAKAKKEEAKRAAKAAKEAERVTAFRLS